MQQEKQIKDIKNIIPPIIKIALSGTHDDVAIMAKYYLEKYIKCVSTKDHTIYY